MIEKIRKVLIQNNIKLNVGMTEQEIINAEKFYEIKFPKDMKEMLMNFVPVSEEFYNWNDYSEENVAKIKDMLEWPFEGIIFDIKENNFWMEEFGEYHENIDDRIEEFIRYKEKIPKLIPIFSHRYIVSDRNTNYPIISVHQTDIIYYGANLLEYLKNEFNNLTNISKIKPIPFWSKIIDM